MYMRFNPVTVRDDALGKIVAEKHLELPGVTFELWACERLSPQRPISNPVHVVSLALTPLPKVWYWHLPQTNTHIQAGPLNFLPALCPLRLSLQRGRHRWLRMEIAPEAFARFTGFPEHAVKPVSNITGTPINAALFRVAHELNAPGPASEGLIEALSKTVMVDLARVIVDARHQETPRGEGLTRQQLARITEFIESADCYTPTIADISELLGISRRHITRLFRTAVGRTIHDYIAEIRLKRATDLLVRTDLSVKEISFKLGFASPSGLAAAFRSATGQSPSQFRDERRCAA